MKIPYKLVYKPAKYNTLLHQNVKQNQSIGSKLISFTPILQVVFICGREMYSSLFLLFWGRGGGGCHMEAQICTSVSDSWAPWRTIAAKQSRQTKVTETTLSKPTGLLPSQWGTHQMPHQIAHPASDHSHPS